MERVIDNSSFAGIVYPTPTRMNYTEWSLVMKVNLQAAGLWVVIESGDGDYHDHRTALIAILRAVPLEVQAGLAVKSMATEASEAIRQVRIGADRDRESNAERLWREFDDITFKTGETIEGFSLLLNTVASQLRILGDDISDKEVIKKMLHVVPEKLEQVAISMETLLDLDSLSIEEAIGRLRAIKQRKKPTLAKETAVVCSSQRSGWPA
jgi:hypothetical protein